MSTSAAVCFAEGLLFMAVAVWLGVEVYYRNAGTDTAGVAIMSAAVAGCFFIGAACVAAAHGGAA